MMATMPFHSWHDNQVYPITYVWEPITQKSSEISSEDDDAPDFAAMFQDEDDDECERSDHFIGNRGGVRKPSRYMMRSQGLISPLDIMKEENIALQERVREILLETDL